MLRSARHPGESTTWRPESSFDWIREVKSPALGLGRTKAGRGALSEMVVQPSSNVCTPVISVWSCVPGAAVFGDLVERVCPTRSPPGCCRTTNEKKASICTEAQGLPCKYQSSLRPRDLATKTYACGTLLAHRSTEDWLWSSKFQSIMASLSRTSHLR